MLKRALALIGAAVVALWILGALGLGDFRMCFAAVGKCEAPNAEVTGKPPRGTAGAR